MKHLFKALAAVQKELHEDPIEKKSKNPHFRSDFASIDAVALHLVPILVKHGLTFYHKVTMNGLGKQVLQTTLIHTEHTDEFIFSEIEMLNAKGNEQGTGSCLTYFQRYNLVSLIGVPPTNETVEVKDDDAEEAVRPKKPNGNAFAELGV